MTGVPAPFGVSSCATGGRFGSGASVNTTVMCAVADVASSEPSAAVACSVIVAVAGAE